MPTLTIETIIGQAVVSTEPISKAKGRQRKQKLRDNEGNTLMFARTEANRGKRGKIAVGMVGLRPLAATWLLRIPPSLLPTCFPEERFVMTEQSTYEGRTTKDYDQCAFLFYTL